jgi:hypothetical protein
MKKVIALLALTVASAAYADQATEAIPAFENQVQDCAAHSERQPSCFQDVNASAANLGIAPEAIAACNNASVSTEYSNCMIKTAQAGFCIGSFCIGVGRDHFRGGWYDRRGRWHSGRGDGWYDSGGRWYRGNPRRGWYDRDRRWHRH